MARLPYFLSLAMSAVVGGLNMGDKYSHLGDKKDHWRDTDVLLEGRGAHQVEDLFVSDWNGQGRLTPARASPEMGTSSSRRSASAT